MSVWDAVADQERVVALLRGDLSSGRLSHAYLFRGMAGSGLRRAAAAFAAAVVCDQDGCGRCPACAQVARHAHPDVETIEPAGMQLLVDQVRDVVRSAWRKPVSAARRVIVVLEADRMNPNAQNAFLKALEEPPASTVLVLVAAAPEALLETVRSRCREVAFSPASQDHVAAALRAAGVGDAQARSWARIAGSRERALALATDEAVRVRRRELAERVLQPERDPGDALDAADWLSKQAKSVRDAVAVEHKAELEELADWYNETRRVSDERLRREQRRAEQDALEAALDDVTAVLRDLVVCLAESGATAEAAGAADAADASGGPGAGVLNTDLEPALRARAAELGPGRVADVLAATGHVAEARRRLRSNGNVLLALEAMFLQVHACLR